MNLSLFKNRKGSALLVALLMMGVITAISLVLSVLILRELRVTKDLLDGGKAYYAAESGIEMALYELKNSLPGWEPNLDGDSDGYQSYGVSDDAVGELKVNNRCSAYPCFDEGFDKTGVPPKAFYDVLDLNESITIPLFIVDGGEEVSVGDFVVEFFAPFDPDEDLKINQTQLTGWDVLRWKVFGLRSEIPTNITETISDFTAIKTFHSDSPIENLSEDEDGLTTNATLPSWFGSLKEGCDQVQTDRYAESILCARYKELGNILDSDSIDLDSTTTDLDDDMRSDIYDVGCYPDEAREYYSYSYENFGEERILHSEGIHDCFSISTFMNTHHLKYLSLTNLMNPAVFNNDLSSVEKDKLSKLFFRVEFFADPTDPDTGNETVREFADITAKGYSGDNAQTINVKIQKGSFIPVFNFSLYSTYKDEDSGHNYEYWYGPDEAEPTL
jgi:hypothetical protein